MKLLCATTNAGKLAEFRLAAESFGQGRFEVDAVSAIAAPEETGTTFEENAIQKALHYGRRTSELVFADDSGLEVDALGGAPGVHSARYAGPGASDLENNSLLLERLKAEPNRAARFVCAIALARGGKLLQTFHGEVHGRILDAPRGAHGFGYDPLFFHEPFGLTFGEANETMKIQVSHRSEAVRRMFPWLAGNAATSENR